MPSEAALTMWFWKIAYALAILFIGYFVSKLVRTAVVAGMRKSKVDEMLTGFAAHLAHMLMMTFVVLAALGQLGVQTTSFIAILGAAGLAIGLALQGSLANFAAGVLIILFRPFKVGDYISAGGADGTVEEIQVFTTTLKTVDNRKVIIPNGAVTGSNIVNFTAEAQRRVDLVFGVSYEDDIDKVRKAILAEIEADERIFKDPAPFVGLVELADSSVNFTTRVWTKTEDYWGVYFDLNEKVKKRFDREGISIPFPQQVVYMHQQQN